jgi:hypothetical protein
VDTPEVFNREHGNDWFGILSKHQLWVQSNAERRNDYEKPLSEISFSEVKTDGGAKKGGKSKRTLQKDVEVDGPVYDSLATFISGLSVWDMKYPWKGVTFSIKRKPNILTSVIIQLNSHQCVYAKRAHEENTVWLHLQASGKMIARCHRPACKEHKHIEFTYKDYKVLRELFPNARRVPLEMPKIPRVPMEQPKVPIPKVALPTEKDDKPKSSKRKRRVQAAKERKNQQLTGLAHANKLLDRFRPANHA